MPSVSKRKWTHNGEEREAWSVRYLDASGVKRRKTYARKKDADRFAFKVSNDIEHGVLIGRDGALPLGKVCDEFLRAQEDRIRQGAISRGRYANIKKAVDRNLIPAFGAKKIAQITSVDIEDWFRAAIRGGKLSPSTARSRLHDFNLVFLFAKRRKYVAVNPVPDALNEIGRVARVKVETFSSEQIKAILLSLETRPRRTVAVRSFDQPKKGGITIAAIERSGGTHVRTHAIFRCMVHLAAFCGLRLGEIRALRGQHVKFENGVIEIRHSLDGWNKIKGPKSAAGVRDVPMPEHVATMLRAVMSEHYVKNDLGLIFTTRNALPVPTPDFRLMWYGLLRSVGLYRENTGKQLHFHALRHFNTSLMLQNHLSILDVAKLAGHSHFDVTLRVYSHAIDGGQSRHREAFQNMAHGLIGPIE